MLHGLKDSDKPKRKAWAMHMLDGVHQDIDFLNLFVFSDECTFFVSGHVNTHNNRYWSTENPHELVEHHRGTGKVNVWCALAHDQVVAIHFFNEPTVCGGNYLDMLEQYAIPVITDGGANRTVIFQQDGAPPHYAKIVRDYLNSTLPQRWCGRGGGRGYLAWPPRSPDLTPLDFFLWGHVKNLVYQEKIRDIDHLKTRILDAINSVTPDMLKQVWRQLDYRLEICRATDGSHIELR